MDDRTIAERRFDELVAERRAQGRKTYGRGLDHDDNFCWKMMALEEALDMGQYLMAHIVRLEQEIAEGRVEARVEWTTLADGVSCDAKVNGYLVEVRPSYAGDGWWAWKAEQPVKHRDRQHGHKRTKELAQDAAIAATRGLK